MLKWIRFPLLASCLCGAPPLAADALTLSTLPITLTLSQARYQSAVTGAIAGQVSSGQASGKLYDGAVEYQVKWDADLKKALPGWRSSGKGVVLNLSIPVKLIPKFVLRKGAEHTYYAEGCNPVQISLIFSVSVVPGNSALSIGDQPATVSFPRNYRCAYHRNLLGTIVSIVKPELKATVDVVPLMVTGIQQRVGHLQTRFSSALSAQVGNESLRQRLGDQLAKPWQVSPNVWLSGDLQTIRIHQLSIADRQLLLSGTMMGKPAIGFGRLRPDPAERAAAAGPEDVGFRLPFDLIIPREAVGGSPGKPHAGQYTYRFRDIGRPGVAAITRRGNGIAEDVVLVSGGTAQPIHNLPMSGAIDGVLEEIIGWLDSNPGVRNAAPTRVDPLLDEVRRVASLVAYFQRPRTLELGSTVQLTLSNLRADLHWIALDPLAVRAGVVLNGEAKLAITL
ncbi:MAG: hypothetical protein KDI63_13300 [Gammaproteobacteria bacterium]|nr:hypothetical protein [Gammaproteobacteria bacterium]